MSAHFVFIRFFLGFSPEFPFARFAPLTNEEIIAELREDRRKQESDPDYRRKRRLAQRKSRERIKKWMNGALAMPMDHRRSGPVDGYEPPKTSGPPWNERKTEKQQEEEHIAWITQNITPPYPLAECDTKEQAEAAQEALQRRAEELRRADLDKNPYEESPFTYASPHFTVFPASGFGEGECIAFHERIDRLLRPREEKIAREEALARVCLPELKPILDLTRTRPTLTEATAFDRLSRDRRKLALFVLKQNRRTTVSAAMKEFGKRPSSAQDRKSFLKKVRECEKDLQKHYPRLELELGDDNETLSLLDRPF